MSQIGTFFLSIITAIAKRIGGDIGPYAIAESKALLALSEAVISVFFDNTLSKEEKKLLYQAAKNDLQVLLETAKAEGKDIAADMPKILLQAGSDEVMGALGFDQP